MKHVLMTEAANSSEKSKNFSQTTSDMPEDSSLHNHRHLSLTPHILQFTLVSTLLRWLIPVVFEV